MNPQIKWIAELRHVRDVSILGTADLAYWKDRLRAEDLLPAENASRAQILVVGGDARFAGIGFRELSFSVLLSPQGAAAWRNRAYLVHALNSCRAFAFCERTFFSTPYHQGDVHVSASFPASIEVVKDGDVVFRAQMQTEACPEGRRPACCREDGWEGPVFLPKPHGREVTQGKLFFARINGYTKRYPFLKLIDSLAVRPSPEIPVLQALCDSHFAPTEWITAWTRMRSTRRAR
jgi:hypothetical protein